MPIATKLALEQCNFECDYCWQSPESRTDIIDTRDFNFDRILNRMEELYEKYSGDQEIVIHGGEVTAYPRRDLELLLEKSYEIQGYSSIQSNGYKIDKFFDLFEKYNTTLGISFDGYGKANLLRGFGSEKKREKQAEIVSENIFQALDRGLDVGVISIITRQNGIDHIDRLKDFLLDLKEEGSEEGRLNPCTVTDDIDTGPSYELEMGELIKVYDDLMDFCLENGLKYSPFKDMGKALQNKSRVCKFSKCDFYSTPSLIAIHKDGSLGNCVKTYRGERRLRADEERKDIRSSLLRESECQDCEWFPYCLGGCPNDGINGDWRRKSKYCPLYKHLWKRIGKMSSTFDFKVESSEESFREDPSHRHGDSGHGDSGHGDKPHGDRPHGDAH